MANNGKCVVCGSMLQQVDSLGGIQRFSDDRGIMKYVEMPRPKAYLDNTLYSIRICPSCGLLYGVNRSE